MNFTVITDHSALKALKDKFVLTGFLLHRAEKLLEYDFDVIYCAIKEHVVSDFLSRIYLTEMSVTSEIKRDCCLGKKRTKSIFPLKTGVVFWSNHIGHKRFTYAQLSHFLLFHNISSGQVSF